MSVDLTVLILAGGAGRRMDGRDKGWIDYRGMPLIEHALTTAAAMSDNIIINCNRSLDRYRSLGYPCVTDNVSGYPGPLAGIASCQPHISTSMTLVMPCDTPNLDAAILTHFRSALGEADLVTASSDGHVHNLHFLCRTRVLATVSDHVKAGDLRVAAWLAAVRHHVLDMQSHADWFVNVNRTEDITR